MDPDSKIEFKRVLADTDLYEMVKEVRQGYAEDRNESQEWIGVYDHDTAEVYLLLDDGRPVASGIIIFTEQGYMLENITTKTSERGKGYFKVLMKRLEEVCHLRDPEKQVHLDSYEDTIPLYQKAGYVYEGPVLGQLNWKEFTYHRMVLPK